MARLSFRNKGANESAWIDSQLLCAQVTKRYKEMRKHAGRGKKQNFAGMQKEAKRKADEAQREAERRAGRAAVGIVELGEGGARPEGEGVEVEGLWYPLEVHRRIEAGELRELAGPGVGPAEVEEVEAGLREGRGGGGADAGAAGGEADSGGGGGGGGGEEAVQPARKKAKRVKAPAKKKGAQAEVPLSDVAVE